MHEPALRIALSNLFVRSNRWSYCRPFRAAMASFAHGCRPVDVRMLAAYGGGP
jgi:hypothetical protein